MKFLIIFVIVYINIWGDALSYNRGEMLYFSNACSSCHGPSAEGSNTYPKLANKKSQYLRKKLNYFRVGKVGSVSQQMMSQFAAKLTDREISDLTYFLSHHKNVELEDVDDDLLGGFGS